MHYASYGLVGYTMKIIRGAARIATHNREITLNTLAHSFAEHVWAERLEDPNPFLENFDLGHAPPSRLPSEMTIGPRTLQPLKFGRELHRCLLIDRCPGCGHRLNRSRPAIHECKCGFDLRMARSEHADSILVTVNAAIYRAAGFPYGTSHVDLISAKFEPTFLSLQLDSCLSLVCFAGSTQEQPNKQSTNHRRVAADIVISRRLGTAAGELLRD